MVIIPSALEIFRSQNGTFFPKFKWSLAKIVNFSFWVPVDGGRVFQSGLDQNPITNPLKQVTAGLHYTSISNVKIYIHLM